MFVRNKMKRTICLFFLILLWSCASIDPAILSEEELKHAVWLAREKVSTEIKDLSGKELHFIKTEQPKYSYYKLSGNYADYSIYWYIEGDQGVVVSGRGDILRLEGAKIERIGNPKIRGVLQWSKERQTITECKSGRIYWVRVLASNPHFLLTKKVEEISSKGEAKIIAEFSGEIQNVKPSSGPDYSVDGTLVVNKVFSVKLGDCNN